MLGAGALGRPRGMVWEGRREEGSGWGTHVYLWQIHFDIWQNKYNIVKLSKIKLKKKENHILVIFKGWLSYISNITNYHSVQLLSCVRLFVTPWTAARQASLSVTNSRSLLKLTSIKSVMPSNHVILCRPLLLLPSVFPSIRIFSNEWVLCIRGPKYGSFTVNPFNEYLGLISFRMDWLDLHAV